MSYRIDLNPYSPDNVRQATQQIPGFPLWIGDDQTLVLDTSGKQEILAGVLW